MAAVNVERMSLKQIEVLEAQIAKAKTQARETSKAELKAKIDRLLDGSEFTIAETLRLQWQTGRAGKSAAKYANPDDPSQTWTRARPPARLADCSPQEGCELGRLRDLTSQQPWATPRVFSIQPCSTPRKHAVALLPIMQ